MMSGMDAYGKALFTVALGGVLAVSGTLSGCEWFGGKQTPVSRTQEVRVEVVRTQPVTLVSEVAGRTVPYQVAEVRPQVSGIIKARHFVEGRDVQEGQPLYQIDPDTYKAAYESAKATYVRAKANLEPMRLKAQRFAELVKVKAVSQQEAADMQAAYTQARADVDVARAAMNTARIRLNYTKVFSPISGRAGISTVTPGALVTEAQGAPLTTVQQLDPMYVDITQSSVEVLSLRRAFAAGKLKAGSGQVAVKLRLEDGSDYPLSGTLQFTDVTVDRSTGMVTLRAIFPNPKMELLPNMYVRAFISVGMDEAGILLDQRAVVRDSKGNPFVYVVTSDSKIKVTPVKVSRVINNCWVVDEGLKPGDRVVVEGLQRIRQGVPVTVVGEAPAVK